MAKRPEYYLGRKHLRGSGAEIEMDQHQQEEYIKCANDPIYFFENYINIIHVDKGKVLFRPYDFQKDLVRKCVENRFVIAKVARQSGKCVHLNTTVKVRNKKSGEIETLTVGQLYEKAKDAHEEDV